MKIVKLQNYSPSDAELRPNSEGKIVLSLDFNEEGNLNRYFQNQRSRFRPYRTPSVRGRSGEQNTTRECTEGGQVNGVGPADNSLCLKSDVINHQGQIGWDLIRR